jgi:hypothetical protein
MWLGAFPIGALQKIVLYFNRQMQMDNYGLKETDKEYFTRNTRL